MIFKPQSTLKSPWLHDGTLEEAISWEKRINETMDVGYLYLLGYTNGHTKVGATSYFPARLRTHQRDTFRWGIRITRCMVTRPVFNYRQIELAVKRQFAPKQHHGETFFAPIDHLANFILSQNLAVIAPENHGRSRRSANQFLSELKAGLGRALGLNPDKGIQGQVLSILDQHKALGRATGLSERDATINALASIEGHTGLNLSAFHDLLREVA